MWETRSMQTVPPRLHWGDASVLVCSAESGSAWVAREWVVGQLRSRLVEPAVCQVAQLLVSELVGNVVRHTRSTSAMIHLAVGSEVTVAVHDRDRRRRPVVRRPDPTDACGRGLVLVESLADAWGSLVSPAGKWVWFALARPPVAGPG